MSLALCSSRLALTRTCTSHLTPLCRLSSSLRPLVAARPYIQLMRLDKPIGTWLLFLPSAWGIVLATPQCALPSLDLLALFGVGAIVMRGAGCTINDLWDRDYDKQVARTQSRPLASGELSRLQATTFLGLQLGVGLAVLLQLNWFSVAVGAASLPLVVAYPLMKRITFWPQAFLGVVFNWGVFLGPAAVTGAMPWGLVLPLHAGAVCWTLVYDTLYAHQDKKDDASVGVKSTALLLGDRTKPALYVFTAATVALWTLAGINTDQLWPYYIGVLASGALSTAVTRQANLDSPSSCMEAFKAHKWVGLAMLTGCATSTLLQTAVL